MRYKAVKTVYGPGCIRGSLAHAEQHTNPAASEASLSPYKIETDVKNRKPAGNLQALVWRRLQKKNGGAIRSISTKCIATHSTMCYTVPVPNQGVKENGWIDIWKDLKKLKKIIAVLCASIILFSATGASAAPGDVYLFSGDQKETLGLEGTYSPTAAMANDTLYSLWDDEIYAWQPGEEQPACVAGQLPTGYYSSMEDAAGILGDKADQLIGELVSDGTTLYGFNTLNGMLFPLTFADGSAVFGQPVQLAWDDMAEQLQSDGYLDITSMELVDGKLYTLIRSNDDYDDLILTQYDLGTGTQKTCNTQHIQLITPYRDGKLLVEIYDYETAYNEDTQEMANATLGVYDPALDSVSEIGVFGDSYVGGLAYDAQTDTLYYDANGRLMAMPALGEATQVAYLPTDGTVDGKAWLLPGGLYALHDHSGIVVRNTDAQYLPTQTLSIYGNYMDEAGVAFSNKYPGIPLTFNQSVYFNSAQEMAQAMSSGDDAFDVYTLTLSYNDFASLMEKGFCLGLSGDETVSAELSQMYPFLQDAVQYNGTYYAVPLYLQSYGLSINKNCWEENDLTDRIPDSFMGMLDFINWWTEEGMQEYPDLILFEDVYEYQQMLSRQAMNLYMYQYQAKGEALALNTPQLQRVLQAVETLDFDTLNDSIPQEEASGMITSTSEALFATWGNAMDVSSYSYYQPLLIPLEEGGEINIPVDIEVMFINPNTKNADMAMLYLQTELAKMNPQQHIMMYPDDNEPIVDTYYLKMVEDTEKEVADAQEKLKTATPEEAAALQNVIDSDEMILANKDKYYWLVSQEGISAYRQIVEHCFAAVPSVFNNYTDSNAANAMDTLFQRYLQKQIPLAQFLSQMDDKVRMMQMERQ